MTAQLLYEITGPRYLNPDVTTRFDSIALEQVGPDRVAITGVRGEAPPPTSKVCLNLLGAVKASLTFPLVGLSNADNTQIMSNGSMYGTPFHLVVTAEDAQSYKPRMRGFEVMLDKLNARPEDLLHVSSSFRYDLMTAHDLGIRDKAWVKRGHEPRGNAEYGYHEIDDVGGLAGLVGL